MEFCVPWQNWSIEDIHYGVQQVNTRIDNGLFVPIFYANQNLRCQAFHVLTPALDIKDIDSSNPNAVFLKVRMDADTDFGKRLLEFDERNLQLATTNKTIWWSDKSKKQTYHTAVKILPKNRIEWQIQIPDSGIFTCYDTQRKSWYASNESNLQGRKWKLVARTSGLWIDNTSFGMEWKLIGAFVI
jgi:hypothetical protein